MKMSGASLGSRLRGIDPARARLQTEAIAALNAREIGGLRTAARVAAGRDRRAAVAWILFDTGGDAVALAPLLVDGTLARLEAGAGRPDGVAAAAALASIEPLVAAIEAMLGTPLRPHALAGEIDEARLMIRLDAAEPGGPIVHRVLVALPAAARINALAPAVPSPMLARAFKLKLRGRMAGPPVALGRLAALGVGDLLLLGIGPRPAELLLPGMARGRGARLDLHQKHLILDRHDPVQGNLPVTNDADDLPGEPQPDVHAALAVELADVRLPSTIEFDGGSFSPGELATLGEGSVLPVAAPGGTLTVRIVAGERVWADGELVAVGDGVGVLVTGLRAVPGA